MRIVCSHYSLNSIGRNRGAGHGRDRLFGLGGVRIRAAKRRPLPASQRALLSTSALAGGALRGLVMAAGVALVANPASAQDYSAGGGVINPPSGEATAVGQGATTTGVSASAYGFNSNANGTFASAFGAGANANGTEATATGFTANANGGEAHRRRA